MLENAQTPTSQVVGSRDDAWNIGNDKRHHLVLVFIPCHIEPDMRFSLIRLSDNLRPATFKARPHIFHFGRRIQDRVELSKHERQFRSIARETQVLPVPIVRDDSEYIGQVAEI